MNPEVRCRFCGRVLVPDTVLRSGGERCDCRDDLRDLDTLIRASKRSRGVRSLITPCCGLVPFLRDYLLWCPGMPYDDCGKNYATLAELVPEDGKAA